jgi:L-ascorbate metabolism protein UlaG (beta-lactamase superfamily)
MTITKYGHCCLLLEIAGKRILTDPGTFSTGFETLTNLDIILITHEHADHCHTDSVTQLIEHNPEVIIVTNSSVAKLLTEQGIDTHIIEGTESATVLDVLIEAYDGKHEEIFESYGIVQNTGYLIDNTFFYPGDAFTVPNKSVHVLALPVAGPWCKVADAIRYGIATKTKTALPVHDAVLSEEGKKVTYGHFTRELAKHDITFVIPEGDKPLTIL